MKLLAQSPLLKALRGVTNWNLAVFALFASQPRNKEVLAKSGDRAGFF